MDQCDKAMIISQFLKQPDDKQNIKKLFELSQQLVKAFLIKLKTRGWRLPIHERDENHSISDLAIDILGEFFQSRPHRSFHVIFDYFDRQGMTNYDKDIEEVYDQYRILLWSFTKQALYRLTNQENPQIANLKRRIKEILKSEEYSRYGPDKEFVYLGKYENELRDEKDMITKESLNDLVETAYLRSKTRSELCRNIFRFLNDKQEYCNFLRLHDLIESIISINSRHVELDGNGTGNLPDPRSSLRRRVVNEAIDYALGLVKTNEMKHYILKKRIEDLEAAYFLEAARHYLMDKGNDGSTDSIPTYFREVTPANMHKEYLNKYKYIFETIINRADDYFVDYLKKQFIKRKNGHYF